MNNNNLLKWFYTQKQSILYIPEELSRVKEHDNDNFPQQWNSPMSKKILTSKILKNGDSNNFIDPNKVTVLGGMCLLNTQEMKRIHRKELIFSSEDDFKRWYASWYPRIDQLHDTVGIPPRACKQIIYVSEDSFFAKRLASYTGLDRSKLEVILKDVHEKQGHHILKKYLQTMGYNNNLQCIYTSELENILEITLRMWERTLGTKIRTCDRDFAKVELMYTGFWLDILNISNPTVIYEAATKMKLRGWLKLDQWFLKNVYMTNLNYNLGVIGYIPFLTTKGDGSVLRYEEVPNLQNFRDFEISENDIPWYVLNLLFNKKTVNKHGPLKLQGSDVDKMIKMDFKQYYE